MICLTPTECVICMVLRYSRLREVIWESLLRRFSYKWT